MISKTKIIVNAHPMANVNTGISRYLRFLYRALEEQYGDRLEIGYFDGTHVSKVMPSGPQNLTQWSKILSLFWKLPTYPALMARLLYHANQELHFHRVVGDFDLYHESAYFPFVAPKSVKTVFTLTDLSLIRFPEHHPRERVMYSRAFFRRRCKNVSRFLTISSFIQNEMAVYLGISAKKTTVTHPGFDPAIFYPRAGAEIDDCLKRFGLQENYFLFVGTGDPRKNIAVIPRALGQSGLKTQLVIAGWQGWVETALWEQSYFLGYVDDADLARLYSGALALVFPSRYEGFGLPLLEAMACGCPVVTTREASIPEVAGDAAAYMKDPDDAEGLALTLKELAEIPEKRQAYVEKGLKRATCFSWRRTAELTFKAFEVALETREEDSGSCRITEGHRQRDKPLRVVVGSQFMNVQMGGAEKYIYEICSRLENDYQMSLDYLSGDQFGTLSISSPSVTFLSSGFCHAWRQEIATILRKISPDVVYVHYTVPWISDVLLRTANDFNIPSVVMYHSDVTGPEFTKKIIGLFYRQLVARRSFELCERLLVPSRIFAEGSPYLAGVNKEIIVAPPGVEPVMAEGQRNKKLSYLLFVGKPQLKSKGLDLLVKAFSDIRSRWPDMELVVIGHKRKVYSELAENGVRHIGYVSSRRELADWYASASVTIMPSTNPPESFGMVIAEALLAGCPVVGPNRGGIPGLIEDGLNGYLFSPEDGNTLSRAIERAIKNKNALRRYILKRRKHYQEQYNWDRTAEIVADTLESIARRNSQR
ncbi:MAG: glycosyltransferase [Nitrospina sp.]|nr:glycosyltransferase [Nitrospina sp.]